MTPEIWQEVAFLVLSFGVLANAISTYRLSRLILRIMQRTTTIEITEVWKRPEQPDQEQADSESNGDAQQ